MTQEKLTWIARAEYLLEPGRHSHESRFAQAIDDEWRVRRQNNARLFDGETVLATRLSLANGGLRAACRRIRYAGFLHWLANPETRREGERHIYVVPAIITADGYCLMGRMADHTANPGRVYFPSGTFEPTDFPEGACDFDANLTREVHEETGLDLAKTTGREGYWVYESAAVLALIRVLTIGADANALKQRIDAHLARPENDELAEILFFGPGETDPDMSPVAKHFMQCLDDVIQPLY